MQNLLLLNLRDAIKLELRLASIVEWFLPEEC